MSMGSESYGCQAGCTLSSCVHSPALSTVTASCWFLHELVSADTWTVAEIPGTVCRVKLRGHVPLFWAGEHEEGPDRPWEARLHSSCGSTPISSGVVGLA